MEKIVVIGGGFGGVYAAKNILKKCKKNEDVKVTLINKSNYFLFVPMLHEVATGSLSGYGLTEPIREIIKGKNFEFIKDCAKEVNLKKREVTLTETKLRYDYLILATGSTANFYNIPGAEKFTFPLKGLRQAYDIKNHVIESVEHAFMCEGKKRRKFATVAIIGAGATGIELSIEIKEFVDQLLFNNLNNDLDARIVLIHAGDKILPQFPKLQKDAQKALEKHNIELLLNERVTEIKKGVLKTKSGKKIEAETIIWTAGIKPNVIKTEPEIKNKDGKVIVNEFLQLKKFNNVYVIGDTASYTQPGKHVPMPALAQVASESGKHVAKNIFAQINSKPLQPFTYKLRGIMMSLGRGYGVGLIKGIKVKGFGAWFLMRTVYLFKILGLANKLKTAYDWTLNLFIKRETSQH